MTTNTKKSGYAKDIAPERLEKDEQSGLAVPVADSTGMQTGVLPPSRIDFRNIRYKAVSLDEAERLMHMRTTGKLNKIGLDRLNKPAATKTTKGAKMEKTARSPVLEKKNRAQRELEKQRNPDDYDPLGSDKEPEPGSPELEAEERRLVALGRAEQATQDAEPVERREAVRPSAQDIYLERRIKVALELQDGSMFISVVDIKESTHSITLILPSTADAGSLFIPKAGTELTVNANGKSWHCFFPGTWFQIDELGIIGLVFVKAD